MVMNRKLRNGVEPHQEPEENSMKKSCSEQLYDILLKTFCVEPRAFSNGQCPTCSRTSELKPASLVWGGGGRAVTRVYVKVRFTFYVSVSKTCTFPLVRQHAWIRAAQKGRGVREPEKAWLPGRHRV